MKDLLILFRVQARIATFLADLGADHLIAIAEGRARLTIVPDDRDVPQPVPAPVPAPRASVSRPRSAPAVSSSFDAEEVAAQLRSCATVDQGAELLAKLKPRVADLKDLARFLGLPASGTKDVLAKRILTITLASRGKHAALTQG